jgi:hypothetical protein
MIKIVIGHIVRVAVIVACIIGMSLTSTIMRTTAENTLTGHENSAAVMSGERNTNTALAINEAVRDFSSVIMIIFAVVIIVMVIFLIKDILYHWPAYKQAIEKLGDTNEKN